MSKFIGRILEYVELLSLEAPHPAACPRDVGRKRLNCQQTLAFFVKFAKAQIMALLMAVACGAHADTMDHYMEIVSNIPKMEVKADGQAQVWAKSARNVLTLTGESIAESLVLANQIAAKQGSPLFCLPNTVTLNGDMLNNLIQETYQNLSSQASDKAKMTVSQVALLGLSEAYPCASRAKGPVVRIRHVHGLPALGRG